MKFFRYTFITILLFFIHGCETPENVICSIECPITVNKGDEFIITVNVKNIDSKKQTLVSLDIGDEYLAGIAILKTIPDYYDLMHIPIDQTVSYTYNLNIGPGDTSTIKLYAKALSIGDYSSEIDFCINSSLSFLSKSIRTLVE